MAALKSQKRAIRHAVFAESLARDLADGIGFSARQPVERREIGRAALQFGFGGRLGGIAAFGHAFDAYKGRV